MARWYEQAFVSYLRANCTQRFKTQVKEIYVVENAKFDWRYPHFPFVPEYQGGYIVKVVLDDGREIRFYPLQNSNTLSFYSVDIALHTSH